jgi:hypothetical protein
MDASMRYTLNPQVVTLSGTPVWELNKGNELLRSVVEGLVIEDSCVFGRYRSNPSSVTLSGIPGCELAKGNKVFRNVVEGLVAKGLERYEVETCRGKSTYTSTARWNSNDAMENYLVTAPLNVTSDGKTEDIN